MIDINDINTWAINRINSFLYANSNQLTNFGLFDTQIIAITENHVFRDTRYISNTGTIELPLAIRSDPELVIAVAIGFYMVEASIVDRLLPDCRDYLEEWQTEFSIPPTALDLTIFTKDCDLLEERIKLINIDGVYQLTNYFYEPEIYQDARSRVTDEHSVLDELILQLA